MDKNEKDLSPSNLETLSEPSVASSPAPAGSAPLSVLQQRASVSG